jgi:hypothetical protein
VSRNGDGGAIAAMARDENGTFLGASGIRIGGMSVPETLEAMAVREGVHLAQYLLLSKFTIASDCLAVVKAVSEQKMGSFDHVLEEIKSNIASFSEASIVHENRASNKEPHNLARLVLSSHVGRYVWLGSPPNGICIPCTLIL